MTDLQIIDRIETANKGVVNDIQSLIFGYTSSMTILFTSENQTIKKSIDKLTEKVEIQNGSLRELQNWKAGISSVTDYKEREALSTRQRATIIVSGIIGCSGIIVSIILKLL